MPYLKRCQWIFGHDIGMVVIAFAGAYLLRYTFSPEAFSWRGLVQALPVILVIQGLVLWNTGLHHSLWRFTSISDLLKIIRAAVLGVLVIAVGLFLFNRMEGVPRTSLLSLYPLFLTFLLGAPRLIFRLWKEHSLRPIANGDRKRVLVLGAGHAGELLMRDMLREGRYIPVGFLDDKPNLRGAKVHGIPVLGSVQDLPEVVQEFTLDTIMIAMPSASNRQMRRVVELCEQTGIPFRTLPYLGDVVSGQVSMHALREVAIEDLLGREPISPDWASIEGGLAGKVVLVSGGGGSIGAELCRQLSQLHPRALIVFEQSEFNLYSIEMELRRDYPELELYCLLGDVCDRAAVEHTMARFQPDLLFHAAAYKHVPMLEYQLREAVRNNVLGTRQLAQAAQRHRVEKFVLISTDKAVQPSNVMGTTKRVAELLCQALNQQSQTRFITVRFGNVLDSAGSVVPLFRQQIARGGPVTVTHPEVTRYFMTIPEACQLIMQASVMGQGGEIFVLDMGESIRILYLAEQMIRLSGRLPGEDIAIQFTGLRPGEKLHEELFYNQEALFSTPHDKILLARPSLLRVATLWGIIDRLEAACAIFDEARLNTCMAELVPEFKSDSQTTVKTYKLVGVANEGY